MTETKNQTIAHQFLKVVNQTPEAPALIFQDEVYTYAMLHDLSAAFAIRLRQAGVDTDSTVHIQSDDLAVTVAVMLATACLGARLAERAITHKLPLGFPITHSIGTDPAAGESGQIIVDQSFSPAHYSAAEKAEIWRDSAADSEAPWIIVSTSGTTGLPKVVGLSQRLVRKRSHAVRNDFIAGETRFTSLFPYATRPFFARAIAAIYSGATIVDRGPWEFWQRTSVTLVSGSLQQVRTKLQNKPQSNRIAKLEVIGAKLPEAEVPGLLQSFAQIDDTYGATETNKSHSNYYSIGPDGNLHVSGATHESIFEIVDDNDNPVATGESGIVRVKAECAAAEYIFSDTGETRILHDGWFYPGDIGRWGQHGVLDILRRTSNDVIVSGGSKISAKLIDHVFQSFDGIKAAAAFASPKKNSEEVIVFVVFECDVNKLQLTELAKLSCKEQLGSEFVPTKVWPVAALPRHKDGSPDRAKCAETILSAARGRTGN